MSSNQKNGDQVLKIKKIGGMKLKKNYNFIDYSK